MSKIFMEMEVFNAIIDEKDELEKSNSVLRKQSQGYLEDLRAANEEIKDLEEKLKELDKYKALAEDLNNQNLNLLKIKSELEKNKDVVLEYEYSRLKGANEELQDELDSTEEENESLYHQLIKRNDELLKMKEECERLKKANRELEDETYDLEDSSIEYYNLWRAEKDATSKLQEELKFIKDKNEILSEDNERLARRLTSAENTSQEKEKITVQVKNLNDSPLVMMSEETQECLFKDNSKGNEDVNNILGLAMNLVKAVEKLVKDNENLKEDLGETDHHLDEALDAMCLMQYDKDNLIEENLDLKNTEKMLRYQIDEMYKQVENFRKKMHLDITHDDEEAEGMYYPRTFQEGMREIEHLYEGLSKSIDKQNDAYDLKCDDFIRIDKENDILKEKLKNFYHLTQEIETLASINDVWIKPVKELIGVEVYD